MWGLSLLAAGCFLAIAAIKGIKNSFAGFCVCIFIIGNGIGSLETAANPYITSKSLRPLIWVFNRLPGVIMANTLLTTACGPARYAEIRINTSQVVSAVSSVIAPILGAQLFFNFDEADALKNMERVYLVIACSVFLLVIVFYLVDLPEITDADMARQAAAITQLSGDQDLPFRKQYRLFHAAFAQFCYSGAQVALAGFVPTP